MRKLNLPESVSIGELVGICAVFVSLLFDIHGINQNTAASQRSTEIILFERIGDLSGQTVSGPPSVLRSSVTS